MATLNAVIIFTLIALIGLLPLLFAVRSKHIWSSLLLSLLCCVVLVITLCWWSDAYPGFRLAAMGFDINGMTDAERLRQVAPEQQLEARELYLSRFGIGWPLKAIITVIFYAVPYALLVVISIFLIKRLYAAHR